MEFPGKKKVIKCKFQEARPVAGSGPQQPIRTISLQQEGLSTVPSASSKDKLPDICKGHAYRLSIKWHRSTEKARRFGIQSLLCNNSPRQIFIEWMHEKWSPSLEGHREGWQPWIKWHEPSSKCPQLPSIQVSHMLNFMWKPLGSGRQWWSSHQRRAREVQSNIPNIYILYDFYWHPTNLKT